MATQNIEGKVVTVECYGGKTEDVIVWRDLGDVLLVCKPEELEAAAEQGREPIAVGFRRASLISHTESS